MRFAIIAAGEGSRLAEEGLTVPKPLVPIDGVPMIERLARVMMHCGADHIAVIVNSENRVTVEFMKNLSRELPVDLVVKSTPCGEEYTFSHAQPYGTCTFPARRQVLCDHC